jgi:hypothetical protein
MVLNKKLNHEKQVEIIKQLKAHFEKNIDRPYRAEIVGHSKKARSKP